MSEYSNEGSELRLFGAPPGYVGYRDGGQLTNSIKNHPCSVLLIDEIEKAHPKIIEKFLQILEDGRLTSGLGEIVDFSQTFIFFTSNMGVSKETRDFTGNITKRENIVKPDDDYEVISEKINKAIETHFKPEVLNRIGENIVVFDFIREEVIEEILVLKLKKINSNIQKAKQIHISLNNQVLNYLKKACMSQYIRKFGGRGIGNVIEEKYCKALSAAIYDYDIHENDTLVTSVDKEKIVFKKGVR